MPILAGWAINYNWVMLILAGWAINYNWVMPILAGWAINYNSAMHILVKWVAQYNSVMPILARWGIQYNWVNSWVVRRVKGFVDHNDQQSWWRELKTPRMVLFGPSTWACKVLAAESKLRQSLTRERKKLKSIFSYRGLNFLHNSCLKIWRNKLYCLVV